MILHLDMDAFYASVEQLDNPALKGKCVIVGGTSRRGVVCAASYEARKFGVHSAMPIFQARQKCPEGVFVPVRMARYKQVSRRIMSILHCYSPLVEPISIDEAFVDVSGCQRMFGTVNAMACDIKAQILSQVQLTCSIGVAPSKFMAKIASDMNKPNGLTIIEPEEVAPFIAALPINKVPGVGRASNKQLAKLGVRTLGDVNHLPRELLINRLGKFGHRLINLAQGIDRSQVSPFTPPKSVSREQTLSEDTNDLRRLKLCLLRHAELVAQDLRRHGYKARTVTLKLKHTDFKIVTRRCTLPAPTHSSKALYKHAVALLAAYGLGRRRLRLIGLGASGLKPAVHAQQIDLFGQCPPPNRRWEKVDQAIDGVRQKFGHDSLHRASLTMDHGAESPESDTKPQKTP
jgi:DNA polymerase-4